MRGIFRPGGIIIGKQLAESVNFRAVLAEHQMGVLLAPGVGHFDDPEFNKLLDKLAIRTRHKELLSALLALVTQQMVYLPEILVTCFRSVP